MCIIIVNLILDCQWERVKVNQIQKCSLQWFPFFVFWKIVLCCFYQLLRVNHKSLMSERQHFWNWATFRGSKNITKINNHFLQIEFNYWTGIFFCFCLHLIESFNFKNNCLYFIVRCCFFFFELIIRCSIKHPY